MALPCMGAMLPSWEHLRPIHQQQRKGLTELYAPMNLPPTPPGVHLLELEEESVLVEFEEPCTVACDRDGPDYRICVRIPLSHPLVFNRAAMEHCWFVAQCCLYVAMLGQGANGATVGELSYDENGMGRVSQALIAQGVQRRFGCASPAIGTIRRELSSLCVPPQWKASNSVPSRAHPLEVLPARSLSLTRLGSRLSLSLSLSLLLPLGSSIASTAGQRS